MGGRAWTSPAWTAAVIARQAGRQRRGLGRLLASILALLVALSPLPPVLPGAPSPVRAAAPGPSTPPATPTPGPIIDAAQAQLSAAVDVAATNDQWKTLELSWAGGTTNVEPAGWQSVGFDDSGWSAAYIPTDPYPTWVDIAGADWLSSTGRATGHLTSEIWIARYEFEIGGTPEGAGTLTWNVDNYASIWVNGQ